MFLQNVKFPDIVNTDLFRVNIPDYGLLPHSLLTFSFDICLRCTVTITHHLLTFISDKLAAVFTQICDSGKRLYMEKVANSVIVSLDGEQNFDNEVLEGGSIPFRRCQLECLAEPTFICKSFEYEDKKGFGDVCTISDRNYDDPLARLEPRQGVDVYQWKCGGWFPPFLFVIYCCLYIAHEL